MLFENIDILDERFERRRGCFVAVEGETISYIGDVRPEGDFGETYDGRCKLLMPGLYNMHTHVPMTLLRGYAENLPLQRWLQEKCWPFEALISDESALPASLLAIAEMVRFGCVSFTDMYYFTEARLEAVESSGIKANLANGMIVLDPEMDYGDYPMMPAIEGLVAMNGAFGGRLKVELGPHSEYCMTEKAMRGVAEHARAAGIGVNLHVSETRSEHEECKERHGGMTPVEFLESVGLLDVPVTAAHCVWATENDLAILKAHDASVATCPASNLKLGSGIADTLGFKRSGVNWTIGTDGVASNNAHNMFRDMYLAAIAHRGSTLNPVSVEPPDILCAATAAGARAQRRDDCGVLAEGKKADLIVLDMDLPWMQPVSDAATNVVYSASGSEVVLTMVDGKVLYRDGEYPTIDVEKAMAQTQAATDDIVSRL